MLALKENWDLFWGTGHYEILFLISLLYIFITEKNKKNKQMLFWYSVIILFIILNPLFANGIRFFFSIGAVYTRLYLLIPIHIVIAYAMLRVLEDVKQVSGKVVLSAGFLLLLLLSGTTYYQEGLFSRADNFMKIPNEVIGVCNILQDDGDMVKVIAPADLLPYIRQYDADILLCYGRNGNSIGNSAERKRMDDLYAQFENPEIDVEYIVSELQDIKCNYIVYYKNDSVIEQFLMRGYVWIGETGDYVVLKEAGIGNE